MDAVIVEANRAARAEELEALRYIYGDDFTVNEDERSCQISVYPGEESSIAVRLSVFFPNGYPSDCEPAFEVAAAWLSEEHRAKVVLGFHELYLESRGEVIVFKWVEWMKEQPWLWEDGRRIWNLKNSNDKAEDVASVLNSQQVEKPEEHCLGDHSLEELDRLLGVVHGSPFTEKRSTFQAHLASVHSVDQVETVMEALQRNRKIAGATHNIMAYRIAVPDKNTVLQDYDDDGETAAGGRLLHLLQIIDAIDVVVVVSRWFGGILLGPDRFKHINNAARTLLESSGYIKDSQRKSGTSKKSKLAAASSKRNRLESA